MKYPQLVSARAVNAISDWLVSRLEQLGVDAPQIYSRLLLSLLHTPLQINALDLAEISNTKTVSLGLKGVKTHQYHRFSSAETAAIKRLAAIESLTTVAGSDQQLSNIEQLIDDLCEKLHEIESSLDEQTNTYIIDCDSDPLSVKLKLTGTDNNMNTTTTKNNNNNNKSASPSDPTKRYHLAFPALSKDLSDQTSDYIQRNLLANRPAQKALSWPCSGTSGGTSNPLNCQAFASGAGQSAGVKRKTKLTKRRGGNLSSVVNHPKSSNTNRTVRQRDNNLWDTEFDGPWEMGRDLIKEFVNKQNNRNRSISEGDARNFVNVKEMIAAKKPKSDDMRPIPESILIKNLIDSTVGGESSYNFEHGRNDVTTHLLFDKAIRDEGYATPDNLTSLSEIDCNTLSVAPRRLYEREPSSESINQSIDDETKSLQMFEAKFNSNVEALWNDAELDDAPPPIPMIANRHFNVDEQKQTNVETFLYNYYKHHYNNEILGTAPTTTTSTGGVDGGNSSNDLLAKLFSSSGSGLMQSQPFVKPNGGMNLQTSIWSDNIAGDDDASFQSNVTRLLAQQLPRNDNCVGQQCMTKTDNIDRNQNYFLQQLSSAGITTTEPIVSNAINKSNNPFGGSTSMDLYAMANFSKWSDLSYETPPFASSTNSSSSSVHSLHTGTGAGQTVARQPFYAIGQTNNQFSDYKSLPTVQSTTIPIPEKCSLLNHSVASSFVRVLPTAHQKNVIKEPFPIKSDVVYDDEVTDENLLTSERTHFRPIKQTYADGHTFNISNSLDDINYERSDSGTLWLDSQKYMEWNPSVYGLDCISDDMVTGPGGMAAEKFILRFRVIQTDIGCQTDNTIGEEPVITVATPIPKRGYNEAISPIIQHDYSTGGGSIEMMKLISYDDSSRNGNGSATESDDAAALMHMIDTYKTDGFAAMDGWPMATEMKSKCLNNNNLHTLWQHCSACSNDDVPSLPANIQLKKELIADGDEIMSDLKCMQNLYIGSDWEDDDDGDPFNDDDDYRSDLLQPLETETDNDPDQYEHLNRNCNYTTVDSAIGIGNNNNSFCDQQPVDKVSPIFYNVTQFINDLLKPDTAQTLAEQVIRDQHDGQTKNYFEELVEKKKLENWCTDTVAQLSKNDLFNQPIGGIWTADSTIWQDQSKSLPHTYCKWSIDPGLGGDGNININNNNNNSFTTFGNGWEHSNLERIWNNTAVTVDDPPSTSNQSDQIDDDDDIMDDIYHSATDNDNDDDDEFDDVQTDVIEQSLFTERPNEPSYDITNAALDAFVQYTTKLTDAAICSASSQANCDKTLPKINNTNICSVTMAGRTRSDRKRRHSASQNYAMDIVDGALFDKIMIAGPVGRVPTTVCTCTEHSIGDFDDNIDERSDQLTTIITCKYWATTDIGDGGVVADHQQINDPSGAVLLKHVAMVRPLTR